MKHLKQEFDKLTFKEVIVYLMSIITMAAGLTLLFLGMLLPPEGQIHESVLTAYGLICVFVASLPGISQHYSNELSKFKATVDERLAAIAPKQQDKQ